MFNMVSILELITAYLNLNAIQVTAKTEINVSHMNFIHVPFSVIICLIKKCYPYAGSFFQLASYSITPMNNMYNSDSFISDVILLNCT